MRRLPLARIGSALLVLLAVVVWFGGSASADAPVKQGWWSRWQQHAGTIDVPAPLPITITLPPPTTVEGGLTVARSATQEEAVAALYFPVAEGADASLFLAAADDTGVRLPPEAVVQACRATEEWDGGLNGAWEDAPAWSNDFCEPGTVVAGEAGIVWSLPSTMQDEDGVYDLVLVPRGTAPYVVNFAPTSEATLVPDEAPPTTTTTTTSTTTTTTTAPPTTATTEPVVEETDPVVTQTIGGGGGGGAGRSTPPTVATTPTSLVTFDPGRGLFDRVPIPDSRMERIMAVSVLFFMAVALWWLGGSPVRMPRLIGALAADGRAFAVRAPEPRGVGRFARPRDVAVRPPRL